MNKIFIFFIIVSAVFLLFQAVDARTNCDNQAKPAFSCPTGYSMMCNPTGGYHWGCGKESGGAIIEWIYPERVERTPTQEGSTGGAIFQNNESNLDFIKRATEAVGSNATREMDPAVSTEEACRAKCRDQYGGSGSSGFDACIRACGAGAAIREESLGVSERAPVNINTASIPRLSSSVLIKKVEVRGWDPKQKEEFLATVKTHAEVRSGQDLENFARGVLVRDENVESIAVEEEEIQFSYRMPAKFLGIFNASLTARVNVDIESRVKVRFPWLRIFFSKPVSVAEIQESVEKEMKSIKQTMQTQVRVDSGGDDAELANIDLQNKIQHQAQTLQLLSNIMKAQHDTAMSIIQNMK